MSLELNEDSSGCQRVDHLPDSSHVLGNLIGCNKSRSSNPFRSN